MVSSTLHSKSRWPRLALRLLAVVVCTWAVNAAYTLWLNPDVKFLTAAGHIKQDYARKMTREHGAKCVVFGGSSGLFSINGERMLARHNQPTVNMSLHAGCGAKTITEWALTETNPGDTLVVALEPSLLTGGVELTMIGTQFCWAMHSPQWLGGVLKPSPPVGLASLFDLRPGAYHAVTLIGKIAAQRPLFRYAISNIHPSGWVETELRWKFGSLLEPAGMSPEARTFLQSLSEWCQAHQVRVCYSLPLGWAAPKDIQSLQRKNAALLWEISQLVPVLEDRRLGAYSNLELFADTNVHLNTNGVVLRTDEFAAQLRAGRMWNPAELRVLATNDPATPALR
jgi:hypothetical protein